MSANQEAVVKFAERYFKGLGKLLAALKIVNKNADQSLRDNINRDFQTCAINILKIVQDYTDLIKAYTENIKTTLLSTKNQIDQKKEEFVYAIDNDSRSEDNVNDSIPTNSNDETIDVAYEDNPAPIKSITPVKPKPFAISKSINSSPIVPSNIVTTANTSSNDIYSLFESLNYLISLSENGPNVERIVTNIENFFITCGDMANTGIRSIGPALGQLVRMTDNGLERVRTCWDIFNSPHILSESRQTYTFFRKNL